MVTFCSPMQIWPCVTSWRACFIEQAVDGTRERTGVLIYVSLLEDLVAVLPDRGAAGAAPRAEWDLLAQLGRDHSVDIVERLDAIVAGASKLGDAHLPTDPEADVDELPNRPVVGDAP